MRLACIARNEANNIEALAKAVKDKIDSWVVTLDPRTTDDSERLFYEAFEGVPGEVIFSKLGGEDFRFDAARNELLELARPSDAKEAANTWLLLLDVDSPIVGDLPEKLTEGAYFCDVVMGGAQWTMPFLIRADIDTKYVFPAHEVLILPDGVEPTVLPDVFVMREGAGTNPERIAWTIKVLEEEWEASGDPRAAFYLGNMHRDLYFTEHGESDRLKSIEWYIKRANTEGWIEEIYMSIFRTAELYAAANDYHKAIKCFMEALGYRPTRPEPWFELARIFNHKGEHIAALSFAEKGLSLPISEDWLLVARWVERWGLYFEAAVAAWHLNDKDNAYQAFERLLKRPDLSPEYRDAGLKNLAIRDRELAEATTVKPTARTNNRSRAKRQRR